MKTGQDVIQPGWYISECCFEEVMLERDASFPRCWICKCLARWESMDAPDQRAA